MAGSPDMAFLKPLKTKIPNTTIEILKYSPIVSVIPSQVGLARSSSPRTSPSVILMLRWMGAKDAHAFKYVKEYVGLYPEATQIVVAAPQKAFWGGDYYREWTLKVVVELLRSHGVDPEDPKLSVPLLVHTFSNGGALQLMSLARLITSTSKRTSSLPAIPASAIVYDSCPSPITVKSGMTAFTIHIKPPWLRAIASYAVAAVLLAMEALNKIIGGSNSSRRLKEDFLNATLIPANIPRLYIYSKADNIVPFDAVDAMVNDEIKAGRVVRREVYEDTPHVSHVRGDEARYWGAVKRIWEEGMKKE